MSEDTIEDLMFKCEVCEKEFEPEPSAMIEWEVGPKPVDQENFPEGFNALTKEDLEEMDEEELREIKLTPELRDALFRGETVKFGGCICLECQDEMAKQS